jgi:polysaccharide pyruvyl transferase WcaK-like protein
MRILVDSSNYLIDNDNLGDRATFQVMANRLLGLWPTAEIRFITLHSRLVSETHPGLRPLVLGARGWTDDGSRIERSREVEAADLVVATGGGFYSDAFATHACGVLKTLEAACQIGKPAAMMSAGFEPVQDQALLALASSVLPRLALIACREGTTGPAYLESLGVDPDRVVVTGDDTVELAYDARAADLGVAIGVNLRKAAYAGMDASSIGVLSSVLRDASQRHDAPLIPVPISLYGPSDLESIAKLLGSAPGESGQARYVATPQAVLKQVSRCRVLVTGSYHAAVFALSQGIPVVGITDSLHYRTKLGGLARQFGGACTVLSVSGERFAQKVALAIDQAWAVAEEHRPRLLARAVEQMAAGQAAYRRLPGLLPVAAPTVASLSAPVGLPRPHGHSPQVQQEDEALHGARRERDTLRVICEDQNRVIQDLKDTCDLRQREIEKLVHACDLRQQEIANITAEAQRRDDIISQHVAALAALQQVVAERTAWAERMVEEAQQRGEVIRELQATLAEHTALATYLTGESKRREALIDELQAAVAAAPPPSPVQARSSRTSDLAARVRERLVALATSRWRPLLRGRVAPQRPSRHL